MKFQSEIFSNIDSCVGNSKSNYLLIAWDLQFINLINVMKSIFFIVSDCILFSNYNIDSWIENSKSNSNHLLITWDLKCLSLTHVIKLVFFIIPA